MTRRRSLAVLDTAGRPAGPIELASAAAFVGAMIVCEPYRCSLPARSCAARWQRANAPAARPRVRGAQESTSPRPGFALCRGCEVGRANRERRETQIAQGLDPDVMASALARFERSTDAPAPAALERRPGRRGATSPAREVASVIAAMRSPDELTAILEAVLAAVSRHTGAGDRHREAAGVGGGHAAQQARAALLRRLLGWSVADVAQAVLGPERAAQARAVERVSVWIRRGARIVIAALRQPSLSVDHVVGLEIALDDATRALVVQAMKARRIDGGKARPRARGVRRPGDGRPRADLPLFGAAP